MFGRVAWWHPWKAQPRIFIGLSSPPIGLATPNLRSRVVCKALTRENRAWAGTDALEAAAADIQTSDPTFLRNLYTYSPSRKGVLLKFSAILPTGRVGNPKSCESHRCLCGKSRRYVLQCGQLRVEEMRGSRPQGIEKGDPLRNVLFKLLRSHYRNNAKMDES